VRTVLEDPPEGGPVAGIAAGLDALQTDEMPADGEPDAEHAVLVLACDLPLVGRAVPLLVDALAASDATTDGAQLLAPDGRGRLALLVRRRALLGALRTLPDGTRGASVRRLCAGLALVPVPDPADLGADADTWDDVRRLDTVIRAGGNMTEPDDLPAGAAQDAPGAGRPEGPASAGSDLHGWVLSTAQDLGVDPDVLDVDLLLDIARDVAHVVTRPAVPLTTFLIGYAVATGGGDRAALERVAARTAELTRRWDETSGGTR
jgi:molybdopterin-guanine dinucleotide biosynthesis protein A